MAEYTLPLTRGEILRQRRGFVFITPQGKLYCHLRARESGDRLVATLIRILEENNVTPESLNQPSPGFLMLRVRIV